MDTGGQSSLIMLRLSLNNQPYKESVGLLKDMFDNDIEKSLEAVSSDPRIKSGLLEGTTCKNKMNEKIFLLKI